LSHPALANWEFPYNKPAGAAAAAKPIVQLVDLDQEAAPATAILTAGTEGDEAAPQPATAETQSLPQEGQTEALADLDRKIVEVGRGDTLLGLLVDADVPRTDAHDAIEALRTVYDPRQLQVGQEIALLFQQEARHRPPIRRTGAGTRHGAGRLRRPCRGQQL